MFLNLGSSGPDVEKLQRALASLGFKITIDGQFGPGTKWVVAAFQRMYAFNSPIVRNLTIDGIYGGSSYIALSHSLAEGGRCSEHFWFDEFRSPGNGQVYSHRDLIRWMEVLRVLAGHAYTPVSTYRDDAYNRQIGGASNSYHKKALAMDPGFRAVKVPAQEVLDHGFRGGIGSMDLQAFVRPSHDWREGWTAHLDIREIEGAGPRWWRYDGQVPSGYGGGAYQPKPLSDLAHSLGLR